MNHEISCSYLISNMYITSKQLVLFFLDQVNKIRTHPKAFLQHIEGRVTRINKDAIYTRGDIATLHYQTMEGQEAVKEAYDYLLSKQSAQPLQLSFQLCEAAYAIGGEINKASQQQDFSVFHQKLLEQLQRNGCRAECLDVLVELGFGKDYQLVPGVVIDDGDQQRSRRSALMDSKYKYIGMAVHEHKEFDYQLLIVLANEVYQIYPATANNCQECSLI